PSVRQELVPPTPATRPGAATAPRQTLAPCHRGWPMDPTLPGHRTTRSTRLRALECQLRKPRGRRPRSRSKLPVPPARPRQQAMDTDATLQEIFSTGSDEWLTAKDARSIRRRASSSMLREI